MKIPLSLSTFLTQNHSENRRGGRASSSSGQITAHGDEATTAMMTVHKYCLVRQCGETTGNRAIFIRSMTGSTKPSDKKHMPRPVPNHNPAMSGLRAEMARA